MMPLRALCLSMILCTAAAAWGGNDSRPTRWSAEALKGWAALPIQDAGRIKPLDTYASFKLLKFNGRRSCTTPDGSRLTAVAWLLDTLFYPEQANGYAIFSVDSDETIIAMGLAPHARKRDRYSYNELRKGEEKLFALANVYARNPAKDRTVNQEQIIHLAENVGEYETLSAYLDHARKPIALESCDVFTRLFPNRTQATPADILRKAPQLHNEYIASKKSGIASDDPNGKAILSLFRALDEVRQTATALASIPPVLHEETKWLTPADIVLRVFETGDVDMQEVELFAGLDELAQTTGAPARFDEKAAAWRTSVIRLAASRGEYDHVPMEVVFYRVDLLGKALSLYVFAFLLVAVSWTAPRNRPLYVATWIAVAAPTLLLSIAIAMRCIIRHRPPATTLYETILFTTAVIAAVSLIAEWMNRQRIALTVGAALAAVGMFIAIKYEAREGSDTMPSMVAVLDTNFWLATHITTITMGYAAALLSGAIAHVYVASHLLRRPAGGEAFRASVARMVYGIFCFGFLFTFIGTLLGGVWANESWGRFWGWDPKENGALLIVLWQLASLHAKRGGYIRDAGFCMASIACGMIVAFSWWGV
ncbi:MAG: cytochrome c biogenesis protein CcsA, partial [Candidatus Hydrogenedentes bacterium]|nr:cytochrome c biogenesis protein CcsA [Candidatus Hydrogenedentota bacterium]